MLPQQLINSRSFTLAVAALFLCAPASAQTISGSNGGIQSVTTPLPLESLGVSSEEPGALIDGVIDGTPGSFVAWRPPHTFTYALAQNRNVVEFRLWNDRNQLDSGIGDFSLVFRDENGDKIGDVFFGEAQLPPVANDPTPEVFSLPGFPATREIELTVWTEATGDPATQFREVAFVSANGTVIDGVGGEIVSVSTAAPIQDLGFGGSSDPAATIDGDVSGSAGTFVEWLLIESAFVFRLAGSHDLTDIVLWNDRGQLDASAVKLRVELFEADGSNIGPPIHFVASPPAFENSPDGEVLSLGGTVNDVRTVFVVVESGENSIVQLREVEFRGECTPFAAAEVVRLGTPPNPAALLPGQTSGPLIGQTWDPVIDHNGFFAGAMSDFYFISFMASNLDLGAPGTLLCEIGPLLFTVVTGLDVGAPFDIPVPMDCALAGGEFCIQAGTINGSGGHLTNALDVTIGTF